MSIIYEYKQLRPKYEAFAVQLATLVQHLLQNDAANDAEAGLFTIEYRAKKTESLERKVRNDARYADLTTVQDLCGVRIVSYYHDSVRAFVNLLDSEFEVKRRREYGQDSVETFGYQSHHLLVSLTQQRSELPEWHPFRELVAEIQVRSILQHAWANISHHLDYKSEDDVPDSARRKLFRVAALLETGDELFDRYRDDVASKPPSR